MNLLIYLEPLHEMNDPFWHEPWLRFADLMVTAFKRRWPSARVICVTSQALTHSRPAAQFDVVVLDHSELVPRFGSTAATVAAHWDAGGSEESNLVMASLLRGRLAGFQPQACISFSPAPFLRAAFPEAVTLFFEHGMVSRPPFPLTGYLDPYDIIRNSALVRLKNKARSFQPTLAEKQFIEDLRTRYWDYIKDSNPLTAIAAGWRKNFPRLLLLAGQFSNFYAFDSYAAQKSPLDLVLYALATVSPSVGVVVTEHPSHSFLTKRVVDWLTASYPNFLWNPEFERTTWKAASQWLMPYVDAVATVSSKVGFETLLWKKPLIVLGSSHLDIVADGHDLGSIESMCSASWPAWKDSVLAWNLTRYTMPFDLLFEGDIFCERLELAMARHRIADLDTFFDSTFAPLEAIRCSYFDTLNAKELARKVERFAFGVNTNDYTVWQPLEAELEVNVPKLPLSAMRASFHFHQGMAAINGKGDLLAAAECFVRARDDYAALCAACPDDQLKEMYWHSAFHVAYALKNTRRACAFRGSLLQLICDAPNGVGPMPAGTAARLAELAG